MSVSHEVHLWGALQPFADGAPSVLVQAATIRDLFRELTKTYPGMAAQIERGVAVSMNGKIYRDQWDIQLIRGAEIYIMPRIAGG